MVTALLRAFLQLPEAGMRRPLLAGLGWSIAVLVLLWLGVVAVLDHWLGSTLWFAWIIQILGVLATPLVVWLLFPSVAIAILGCYSEAIIRAVEARYYPDLPEPLDPGWLAQLASGFRLALVSLVVNIIALPFYFAIPGANFVLFLGLNGYVLGRQYFESVAVRRLNKAAAARLWRDHRMAFIVTGAFVSMIFLIPPLNLIAPIVGLAAAVHQIEHFRPMLRRTTIGADDMN